MPRLTPENKELHTARMRENICDTFAEMFAAEGDVSMEHLAEKMGIAKGTIYNYFKDKSELTAAVMEIRRRAMVELMEKEITPAASAIFQLERFVQIMWEDFHRYRHLRMEYLRSNPVRAISHRPRPLDILKPSHYNTTLSYNRISMLREKSDFPFKRYVKGLSTWKENTK